METNTLQACVETLNKNYRDDYTVPSPELYPHQWLWDSCFTAIGLRHYDIDRAKTEIISLLAGQWHNGMVPNMIFNAAPQYARDRSIWGSNVSPNSPDNVATSGITQPPLIAEAIVKIGSTMKRAERRSWYVQMYPALLQYHQWLYDDRDPHHEGLTIQIHPWETGLDNSPPWMQELHEHQLALWIRFVKKLRLSPLFTMARRDTQHVPAAQRIDTIDALGLFSTQRRLKRKSYAIQKILKHSLFAIEDVAFNSILIRANSCLKEIAACIGQIIPTDLVLSMDKTELAIEQLWDAYSGQYYSRDFVTHSLLKQPSITTLLPLYSGAIDPERAKQLVRLLENQHVFGSHFPIPSVPLNAANYKDECYWQGPTWINTNWLVIEGLERYGYTDHAQALREATISLVNDTEFNEYYNAHTGEPLGIARFSWTAALTIDMLHFK